MDVLSSDLTLAVLGASLRGHLKRQARIAGNIANANTPRYRRRDVAFEGYLREIIAGDGSKVEKISRLERFEPVELVLPARYRNDQGGVDIDLEMAAHAENAITIEALQTMIGKRIGLYRMVIQGRSV